ncbi:hypothetical protein [Mesorhizobium sp. M0217]|uniref:hypothetical protein n=1 Tax=unclassified Mesorhizobium TaxID=325217 RepID=UPI0033355DA0
MSAQDFDQLDPVHESAPEERGLPPTSFPNLLSFLLALLGPWGLATGVATFALVLVSYGLDAAWQASPRQPAASASDVAPPLINSEFGSDTAQQPSPVGPAAPGGEKAN